jgi:uncharacterized lipoprotein NlpE involved in copper resistance
MRIVQKQLKQKLALFIVSGLFAAMPAMAATDFKDQESLAKALAKTREKDGDHSAHQNVDKTQEFHGVFYGFLPCDDCTGIKATLSLKQRNNYLLVTQFAKESSREYFEKGNYSWDESTQTVILTPSKGGTTVRRYRIENAGTLIQLNTDGTKMADDRYVLERSDAKKNREVHIH